MGNFHCIPNGCARVVWQPHEKAGGIRYRYPGEDWVYVDGDDWSTEQEAIEGASCEGVYYDGTVEFEFYFDVGQHNFTDIGTANFQNILGKITDAKIIDGDIAVQCSGAQSSQNYPIVELPNWRRITRVAYTYRNSLNDEAYVTRIIGFEFVRDDGLAEPCPNECTFKVFKNGSIVHEETREDCPEVEILDEQEGCKLSETHHEIIIDKLAWFERVEVVPYAYLNFGLGVFQGIIPEQCLNIYKNNTGTIVPQFEGFPTPTNTHPDLYELVGQICSDLGCPPPEYTVYCDCDCESCPDGTCAIECGDHICCNDSATGKNITSIPIDNYCET